MFLWTRKPQVSRACQNIVAKCPRLFRLMSGKNGEYTLSKTIIISQNVPLDMWKVVLRTLPIDFRHTVEKTSAQNQKTIMKLSLFCKRLFLKNSFSTYRKHFWPTCRNVSLKIWNFFAQSPRKNMNLPFPKKCFLWTPIRQSRQPCRNVSANGLNFPLRFQDHYWYHHSFWKFVIFTQMSENFQLHD